MPSYFYHLRFELYPYSHSEAVETAEPREKGDTKDQRVIWVPNPGTDIFSREWVGGADRKIAGDIAGQEEEIPRTTRKDWRFGKVGVEAIDMPPPSLPSQEQQARSGGGRENAGRVGGATGLRDGGRGVMKADFRTIQTGSTDVGWGVVRLYRDGEESASLSSELVSSDMGQKLDAAGQREDGKQGEGEGGEVEDCTTLCIPAVPSYLTPSDFLGFVGEKTRGLVSHFRMVMTGRMNRYLVLMKFRDGQVARRWRADWDGKVFNSMEPETCHVMFIKSITFQTPTSHPNASFPELSHDPFMPSSTAASFMKPFPPPTPSLVELPTCPVCLERMDDTTGLLTIPCQHVFHCDCLQKWRGTGCPVCRHTNPSLAAQSSTTASTDPPFGSGDASLCTICDCTDDLWICLICGNVGCGRYKGGHAKEHWKRSAHNFALEIETQHVWDYAGDMWVHRLIRGKGDSKVIELPSSSRTGLGAGGRDRDDDMVPREKLESIGMEYTHLLTSQLESQRVYFEELVSKAVAKASAASAAAASASSRADDAVARLEELTLEHTRLRDDIVPNLERDLARERKKGERSAEVARGFGASLVEEKKVTEGLMKRIEHVNKSLEEVSKELGEAKRENDELREENRDLMFAVQAGGKLREMEGEEGGMGLQEGEVQEGTVVIPERREEKRKWRKGRGK